MLRVCRSQHSVFPTMLYSDDSWLVASSGVLCMAIAKNVKVAGSGWTLKECPYTLPTDKRPKTGFQAPAYAYPNANVRIIINDDTGKITIGSGDSYNIDSTIYAFAVWMVGV